MGFIIQSWIMLLVGEESRYEASFYIDQDVYYCIIYCENNFANTVKWVLFAGVKHCDQEVIALLQFVIYASAKLKKEVPDKKIN